MPTRILSIATAAAIALGAFATTAPAFAAMPAAPSAVTQAADNFVVAVRHGGRHKNAGKRHRGKRFGFHLHLGKGHHYGYHGAHCWTKMKVWTRHGWKWQRVYICY